MKELTYYVQQNEQSVLFNAFQKLVLLNKEGRFKKALEGYKLSVVKIDTDKDIPNINNKKLADLLKNHRVNALPVVTLDGQIIKSGALLTPSELSQRFDGLSLQIDENED